ncbi:hypothetical protein [Haloglomus salinum]|uniref:hypothetical protein n=1 Tax=Haloglomus salinum TaxID=2962673 RepID=UPI0020C97D75|nr:hypothetical protein [Haloglomus salinum]
MPFPWPERTGASRWLAALVVLVGLAGCGSLPTAGTPSPSETITPAPVPTDPGTDFPPGIDATGLTDRRALLAAHEDSLANRSYTVTARTTVTLANGSRYRRVRFGGRVGPDGARHVTVSYSGAPVVRAPDGAAVVAIEWWQHGSRRVVRRTYANGSSRTRRAPPVNAPPRGTDWLADDIDPTAVRVVAIADRFVLRTEQPFAFPDAGGPPRADARLEAVVEPTGRIRQTSMLVPVRVAGENATARRVTRVVAVDDSGVQRPGWAATPLPGGSNETT